MAKVKRRQQVRVQKKTPVSPFRIYWEKGNYLLLALGTFLIIVGFYLLGIGPWDSFVSLIISPILLFLGYVLVFPASIFFRKKKETKVTEPEVDAGKS